MSLVPKTIVGAMMGFIKQTVGDIGPGGGGERVLLDAARYARSLGIPQGVAYQILRRAYNEPAVYDKDELIASLMLVSTVAGASSLERDPKKFLESASVLKLPPATCECNEPRIRSWAKSCRVCGKPYKR